MMGDATSKPDLSRAPAGAWAQYLAAVKLMHLLASGPEDAAGRDEADRRRIGVEPDPEHIAIVEGRIKAARLPLFAPIEDRG